MADTKLKTKVENLKAPTRKDNKMSTSWSVPAKATKSSAKLDTKVTGLDMQWIFDVGKDNDKRKVGKGDTVAADHSNKATQKSDTQKFDRKNYHPYAGKPKLANAEFWIRCYNVQGTGNKAHKVYGPWKNAKLEFKKPAAPKSASLSYDSSTGKVTPSYTSEHPDGAKEVHDTQVWVSYGTSKPYDGTAYADVSKTLTAVSVSGATSLDIGKWIKVSMSAVNRGLAGNSDAKTASCYILHPNVPTCGTPSIVYATAGVTSTASVNVPVTYSGWAKDGSTYISPSTLKLQRLKNSSTENDKASAASAQGWADVATVNNGSVAGLTDTWVDSVSESGKFTWFRVVAIRDGYTTYGEPVQAKCLNVKTPSTVAGAASISSLTSGADGKSAIAALTGKQSDDEGYEVSWSTSEDAWGSTEQPSTFETTGSSLVIKGLEENVRCFVRARAYDLDSEGNHVYGTYSDTYSVVPYTTPSVVALQCPSTVERGRDVTFTWTYDTEAQQTEWRLVDSSGTAAYGGEGSSCAKTVTAAEYGSASSLTYHVEMTTGGGWAKSGSKTVTIADAPTCAITAPSTLTAQPYSFAVSSDKGDRVRVAVTALGSTGTGLYGDRAQFAGDTVFSGVVEPAWVGEPRSATVTLPAGLDFHRGADYAVSVTAIDVPTGLESAPDVGVFTVEWSHAAEQATGTAVVDADARAVTVTVVAPASAAIGDVFDLYRVTPDGERRIASAQPFGTAITDRLAPFSHDGAGLHYMAVTRTADGDAVESEDIPYTLACGSLRLDWGSSYLEMPYNPRASDDFSKDSEVRKHLDGTRQAYWNEGVTRKASLDNDLVRFEDAESQELLRDMLQHAGSVFVRTPDGLAFAADVQAGSIERSFSTSAVGVSLKGDEHDLTDECRPTEADIVQPEWGGGTLTQVGGTVYDYAGKFPLYEWAYIGHASTTYYYFSPDEKVYTGTGTLKTGWTWDGLALYDENDDEVEVVV